MNLTIPKDVSEWLAQDKMRFMSFRIRGDTFIVGLSTGVEDNEVFARIDSQPPTGLPPGGLAAEFDNAFKGCLKLITREGRFPHDRD